VSTDVYLPYSASYVTLVASLVPRVSVARVIMDGPASLLVEERVLS
jgi:hypothetical protein